MSKLTLRAAAVDDAESIAHLVNLAFLAERPFVKDERIQAAGVRDLLGKGQFLLGFLGEVLVGCVYVEAHRPRAYLGLLSVDPAHQRAGFGVELMAAAEERCREAGSEGVLQSEGLRSPGAKTTGFFEGVISVDPAACPLDLSDAPRGATGAAARVQLMGTECRC